MYCVNLHKDYSSIVQVRGNDHGVFDVSALSTLPAGKIGLGLKWMLKVSPEPHHLKDINFWHFNKYTIYKHHDNCSYILNIETKIVNTIK